MYHQYREGYIEVICGCMFAGKTEELIRRINVLSYAKQKILVFKPKIDDRYSEIEIASHSGRKVPCFAIDDPVVLVGAVDHYEPRCRHCHEVVNKPIKIKRRTKSSQ